MIKIIGGKHKRININTLDGLNTRPTSIRLREAMFNILLHSKYLDKKIEDMEVIDFVLFWITLQQQLILYKII